MRSSIQKQGLIASLVLVLCLQVFAAQETAGQEFDPAAVMPADTKVYLELGSPGQQLDTIFKMFEGTPLEESISSMLSQGNDQDDEAAGKILRGFLNPSMIAEFKKIQGVAIGLTSFNEDMPDFVAVLSPGQSDALRGVIAAGLSIAGEPGESSEGVQTWNIEDEINIASDGKIFIASNSIEGLKGAIERYKNTSTKSSLVDSKAFERISQQQRTGNVLTMWLNGKQAFEEIGRQMKIEGDEDELAILNMVADPESVDQLVVQLSLHENDIVLDADLILDTEHQCHAYDLIHTPALSSNGFAMLPSDTIALVSISLGDADGAVTEMTQKKLKQITGLDLGREIFANIEQINIFAVDPTSITDVDEIPVATSGIAITSKNSENTKSILDTLLETVYQSMQVSDEFEGLMTKTNDGQYTFSIDGKKLNLFIEQKDNVIVISHSKQVSDKCFSACANQNDRALVGAMKPVFENMPAVTNKLVVVNAGGLLRAVDKAIVMGNGNPFNPAHKQLNEFSEQLNGTNLCIRTSELSNRVNLSVSLDGIPALGPLFPQVMALSEADFEARARATDPVPSNNGSVGPNRACQLRWKPGAGSQAHKVYFGTDASNLKLLKEVSDAWSVDGPEVGGSTEKYYWRVDEVMPDATVIKGDVWNFSTGKLLAHWKLDESDGTIAKDSSGFNHNGTVREQANWCPTEGVQAGAIMLDGKDGAVEIEDFSFRTNVATFTAWVKGWKTDDWSGIVFSRADQPCGMHFGENNTLHYTWNNNNSNTYNWNGGPEIPQDQWAFVAIVIRPDKTAAYVYDQTNGLRQAENKVWNIPQKVNKLAIGCDNLDGTRKFKGRIDDVRIYNYDLSQEEIRSLIPKQVSMN